MQRSGQVMIVVLVAVACLGAGFVSGREYMKFEIRTALADGFRGISQLATVAQPISPAVAMPFPAPTKPSAPSTRPVPLQVSMSAKGWTPSNPRGGEYDEFVTFRLMIKNISDRKVRAFDGVLHITDLLDNIIINLNVAINDPVSPTSPMTWPGTMLYNQFLEHHKALRNAEFNNIKTSFEVHKVLYDDGTSQTFD